MENYIEEYNIDGRRLRYSQINRSGRRNRKRQDVLIKETFRKLRRTFVTAEAESKEEAEFKSETEF